MRAHGALLGGVLLLAACGMGGTFETTPIRVVQGGEWTFVNDGPCTWHQVWSRAGLDAPWQPFPMSADGFLPGERHTIYYDEYYDWRWGTSYELRFLGDCPPMVGSPRCEVGTEFEVPFRTHYADIRVRDCGEPVEVTFR